MNTIDRTRRGWSPSRIGTRKRRLPHPPPPPMQVVVDYRLAAPSGWVATLQPADARFTAREVRAVDPEGILIAVLIAVEDLRIESGRRIETEQIVHDDFS